MALWFRSEIVLRSLIIVVCPFYPYFPPTASHTGVSAPLLPNIVPHLQALVNFVTNTLPKPVLVALLYRLGILHLASRILPTIGADSWETAEGVDDGWDGRPVCKLVASLLSHFSHDRCRRQH